MLSRYKNLGLILVSFIIVIFCISMVCDLHWHSNHQTTDTGVDTMAKDTNKALNEDTEDTNEISNPADNNIKSIDLEKPPFID